MSLQVELPLEQADLTIGQKYALMYLRKAGPESLAGNRPSALPPLRDDDRAALKRLCAAGSLLRRIDGYGTPRETLITTQQAIELKRRRLAVPGWDYSMYPTLKGRAVAKEDVDAK